MQFSDPQKLPLIALVRVFLRILRAIFQQLWPLALAYVFQVSKQSDDGPGGKFVLYFIYLALILTVVNGLVRYLTFRWSLDEDALIIRHGVIRKVNLRIPFERIQAIDLQQPWYYRAFGATRFIVDTAGSKSKEAEIWALDFDVAETLRGIIHEKREEEQGAAPEQVSSEPASRNAKRWIEVNVGTLVKIGFFRNHFRSIAAFIGGAFYLWSQAQDIFESEQVNSQLEEVYNVLPKAFTALMVIGFIVVLAAIAFSIVFTVVRFYGFHLVEKNEVFLAKYGLISTKARQIKPQKVQIMRTEQGPVFKALNILKFKIEQAYAQKVANKDDFTIPGSPTQMVINFKERLLGKIEKHKHPGTSFKLFWFRLTRMGILPLAIPVSVAIFASSPEYYWLCLWFPFQAVYSYLLWKNQGVYIDDDKLSVRRHVWYDRRSALRLERVQATTLRSSIYQRRHKLTTLVIETAGGSVTLPFLPLETAQKLSNYLLYKSEITRSNWM